MVIQVINTNIFSGLIYSLRNKATGAKFNLGWINEESSSSNYTQVVSFSGESTMWSFLPHPSNSSYYRIINKAKGIESNLGWEHDELSSNNYAQVVTHLEENTMWSFLPHPNNNSYYRIINKAKGHNSNLGWKNKECSDNYTQVVAHSGENTMWKFDINSDLYKLNATLIEFKYDEPPYKSLSGTQIFVQSRVIRNHADYGVELKETVTVTKTVQTLNQIKFSNASTLGVGVKVMIKAGVSIPFIGDSAATTEFSFAGSRTLTDETFHTITHTSMLSAASEIKVPARKCVGIISNYIMVSPNDCQPIDFTARMVVTATGPVLQDNAIIESGKIDNVKAIALLLEKAGSTAKIFSKYSSDALLVELNGTMKAGFGYDLHTVIDDCVY